MKNTEGINMLQQWSHWNCIIEIIPVIVQENGSFIRNIPTEERNHTSVHQSVSWQKPGFYKPQQLIDKHSPMTQCKSCINAEEIIHIQLWHDIEWKWVKNNSIEPKMFWSKSILPLLFSWCTSVIEFGCREN